MKNVPRLHVGLFIDGTYFSIASNHYGKYHPVKRPIGHEGLVGFLKHKLPEKLGLASNQIAIPERHIYIGLPNTYRHKQIEENRVFFREMGFSLHIYPVKENRSGVMKEIGVDVALSIDVLEHTLIKKTVDIVVLLSGDGDFSPLADRLRKYDKKFVLLYWHNPEHHDKNAQHIRTSEDLIISADKAIDMGAEIKQGIAANDRSTLGIFGLKPEKKIYPPFRPKKEDPKRSHANLEMGIVHEIDNNGGLIRSMIGTNTIKFLNKDVRGASRSLTTGRTVNYRPAKIDGQDRALDVRLLS